MILEHALLDVKLGQESDFEAAFAEAKSIIASMPGFVSLRLERCIEAPARYLLLVEWRCLEDHIVGFRASPEYQRWRDSLHHFYDPFPTVEHYEAVTGEIQELGGPGTQPLSNSVRQQLSETVGPASFDL